MNGYGETVEQAIDSVALLKRAQLQLEGISLMANQGLEFFLRMPVQLSVQGVMSLNDFYSLRQYPLSSGTVGRDVLAGVIGVFPSEDSLHQNNRAVEIFGKPGQGEMSAQILYCDRQHIRGGAAIARKQVPPSQQAGLVIIWLASTAVNNVLTQARFPGQRIKIMLRLAPDVVVMRADALDRIPQHRHIPGRPGGIPVHSKLEMTRNGAQFLHLFGGEQVQFITKG